MDETQHFRLAGTTTIEKIDCDYVDGHSVIFWEDIEQVFPGVKHIKCNDVTVKVLRGPDQKRIEPHRIKHYPGVVLDVVLSYSDDKTSTTEQRLIPTSHPLDLQVQVRHSSAIQESSLQEGPMYTPNEHLAASLQRLDERALNIETMASKIMEWTSENKELLTRVNKLQEEMKRLQSQVLDRLALLQKSVQALLTQTYELHEYPIPRLFIVLPQDTSSWNPLDRLTHKFRLYFLCECGEHTKSTNSKIPHHIHLAKHEGYELVRPGEFFQRYGSYVLTILQMLKYGITVAGIAVPALSHLISPDALGQVTAGQKLLKVTLEPGMNQVIDYIEKVSGDKGETVVGISEQMDNNEALEGADLRQLESFLKGKDSDRVLGNLYRTVTTEGHVKWVCIDHFRENYQEKASKAFRDAVAVLGGSFDENIGRVEVTLTSKVQAEQFYAALGKARSVYELKLVLDWDTTQGDFKRLQSALAKTNVGVLELHLRNSDGPTSDILNRNYRYDPIVGIMRHPSIRSFTIRGPQNFSKRSSLLSLEEDFSNLRHLDVSLDQWRDDTPGVKCLLDKSSSLSSLALGSSTGHGDGFLRRKFDDLSFPSTLRHLEIPLYQWKDDVSSATHFIGKASRLSSLALGTGSLGSDNDYVLEVYDAIKEHRTYPVSFTDWRFGIPLQRESSQSMDTQQCEEHLLNVYCKSMGLDVDYLDESSANIIAMVTTNGMAFKKLELARDRELGDPFISNICSIVVRSELHEIRICMKEDQGRLRILESMQWKHLRMLRINLKPGTFETRVMRALVDGVKKTEGRVELDVFWFDSETWSSALNLPEENLLQTFVASVSTEDLVLYVTTTLEQMLSILKSVDFSRLKTLRLPAGGFDSVKVDAILEGLQHASMLKDLYLRGANTTEEQKSRMEGKGVTLHVSNWHL